jgi:dephospho-CoA kinase
MLFAMDHVKAQSCGPQTQSRRKPVIGIAGGIGSGKSLVARQFESLGCAVIDADQLSHQVLTEPAVREELVKWWGPEILDASGNLDRKAIGRRVFNAPEELRRLENLVHPRVHALRAALRAKYDADPAVVAVVEDCPLLYEVGLDKQCDVVVFVAARPEVRLERVKSKRGWTEEDLKSREKNQEPLDIKAARADHIVENSESQSQTYHQVRQILLEIIPDQSR